MGGFFLFFPWGMMMILMREMSARKRLGRLWPKK